MLRCTPNDRGLRLCQKSAIETFWDNFPANVYLFKVSNRSPRKMWKKCPKLAEKAPERRQ